MVEAIHTVTYSFIWKVSHREWRGLRVLQVVRKISGPEVEEIMGYWRKLHNEHHS